MNHLYTSESVSAGHPDKVCDQIADAILDWLLTQNPLAHAAVEALATSNRVVIAGEISEVHIPPHILDELVRNTIKSIGYDHPGFSYQTLTISNYLHEQSADIAQAMSDGINGDIYAGDQGIMFGYACKETESYMPAPIDYAHKLLRNLHKARETTLKDQLGPDAKSQVTLKYDEGFPAGVEAVVLSTQHHQDLTRDDVAAMVLPIITQSFPESWLKTLHQIYINPAGRFVIGGPHGDTGLTGRKIMVDTYGAAVLHGGGAFSGKDPSKMDRSGAYMMRYLAKNIVAAGLCDRCTLQAIYVIGKAEPLTFYIKTHNSGHVPEERISHFIAKNFDLSARGIRNFLKLNQPIYRNTATYGHFGRIPEENGCFSWEKLDAVDSFKSLF